MGKYLVSAVGDSFIIGRITETECYRGDIDKASHAYKNKVTNRTKIMFGDGGYAYVYLIYGIYYCMNVVVERESIPCAVLLRGVEIIKGHDCAAQLRYGKNYEDLTKAQLKNFSNGPGKLCIALGIDKSFNGEDLCGNKLFIASTIKGIKNNPLTINKGKRIGIDYAEEAQDFLWRFYYS